MWMTSLVLFIFLQTVIALREEHVLCDDVEIVWREDWKARPSVRRRNVKLPLLQVIIQHTATPLCKTKAQCIRNVQFIQDYHLDYKGWGDIAYNFLIGGDGRAYEGIGWNHEGAHSINFNWRSLGIAFMGNFMEVTPSQKMLDAALNLIKCGVKEGYLAPTYELAGHRDVACTLSPGDKLYEVIHQWDNYKGGRLPSYDCSGN